MSGRRGETKVENPLLIRVISVHQRQGFVFYRLSSFSASSVPLRFKDFGSFGTYGNSIRGISVDQQ